MTDVLAEIVLDCNTLRLFCCQDLTDAFIIFLGKRVGSADTPFIKQSWAKFLGVMNSIVEKVEKEQRT